MTNLTARQQQILNFIQEYMQLHNQAPSFRDIMKFFGFSSLNGVQKHIEALKNKGVLHMEPHQPRSMKLQSVEKASSTSSEIELPFVGFISSHQPIETFAKAQTIGVPKFLVNHPEHTYLLRVKGDGYVDEQMVQGDLLIVEARQDPDPGDTIIAVLNKNDTLVKRYYPEERYIRLMGNSPSIRPLLVAAEDLAIQGVVTGLLRLY